MNFDKLIQAAEEHALPSEVSGRWANIQLNLNAYSPEYLNIGVIFHGDNGDFDFKILDDYRGLECLLKDGFNKKEFDYFAEYLADHIRMCRGNISDIAPSMPARSVRLTNQSFFSGESAKSVSEWLFDETVTLARAKEERKRAGFQYKRDKEVKDSLIKQIHKKDRSLYHSYINEQEIMLCYDEKNQAHFLEIPFSTEKSVGSVANLSLIHI